jgi:hypothetical protein
MTVARWRAAPETAQAPPKGPTVRLELSSTSRDEPLGVPTALRRVPSSEVRPWQMAPKVAHSARQRVRPAGLQESQLTPPAAPMASARTARCQGQAEAAA